MNNNKLPSLVILMILTSITFMFWITFSIYRVFTKDPAPVVPTEVISSIDPRLDQETLNQIKERIYP